MITVMNVTETALAEALHHYGLGCLDRDVHDAPPDTEEDQSAHAQDARNLLRHMTAGVPPALPPPDPALLGRS